MTPPLPPWVIIHLPHASTIIPVDVRSQFLLEDAGLAREQLQMTDHFTDEIFAPLVRPEQSVRFSVSRLVVDPERFEDDQAERMSPRGMGVIYTRTAHQQPLRRQLDPAEREALLARFYRPHHRQLESKVDEVLATHGRCLVIDCHSYPTVALPYELNPGQRRPEICLGTDDFHTPPELTKKFLASFSAAGYETALNEPFPGALVPAKHHRMDRRVQAVMIEVRRSVYLDEHTGAKVPGFESVAAAIRSCCSHAIGV